METFEVVHPGPLTTVQDAGRYGYQQYGVPPAGALDDYAFRAGNILVGNREDAASLEITLFGCRLRILRDTVITVTGADLGTALNGSALPMWQAMPVSRGDLLSFPGLNSGCRAYLAVAGGIDVPLVMGSASTYLKAEIGGLEGRALRKGDIVHADKATGVPAGVRLPTSLIPTYTGRIELRVMLGPQEDRFTREGIRTFLTSGYEVSAQADRMGYRLKGPSIQHRASADIISDGMPPGAVQVPGDGQPIVLLADRQTTGGYAKIATVISPDIYKIAQARPGDGVSFSAVNEAEALAAWQEYQECLDAVRAAVLLQGKSEAP
jgi:biotin-dependent carboxylase-like uncharacterized protein